MLNLVPALAIIRKLVGSRMYFWRRKKIIKSLEWTGLLSRGTAKSGRVE
jgi:hypothetical protein